MVNGSYNNRIKANFVNEDIEKFTNKIITSQHNPLNITINFLGSCHSAAKHPEAGSQYGKYTEVYYNLKSNTLYLTFSGPTKFDIKKPNIKSITQEAKTILNDLIPNISLLEKNIVVNIQGHSRGGIVAHNIHDWLSSIHLGNAVRLGKLSIADPYAGPVNRRINKENDNFDKSSQSNHLNKPLNIPTNKIAVYTVSEKRFRDPAQSLNSDTIVFTDTSHDKTQFVAEYIFNNSNEYNGKLYICADANNEIKKMYAAVDRRPTEAEQKYISMWFKKHIEPIDEKNIDNILKGTGIYKNFSYQKISSDGRRELLYTAIAISNHGKYQELAKEYLEHTGRSKSMWKKVKNNLIRLGISV